MHFGDDVDALRGRVYGPPFALPCRASLFSVRRCGKRAAGMVLSEWAPAEPALKDLFSPGATREATHNIDAFPL